MVIFKLWVQVRNAQEVTLSIFLKICAVSSEFVVINARLASLLVTRMMSHYRRCPKPTACTRHAD